MCKPSFRTSTNPLLYSNPKSYRSSKRFHMNEIRYTHCNLLYSIFCSPFSSLKHFFALSFEPSFFWACLNHLQASDSPLSIWFTIPSLYLYSVLVYKHSHLSVNNSSLSLFLSLANFSDSPFSYRPISLSFCASKLFEKMVIERITYFFKYNNILSPVQAGFKPSKSTEDQVFLLSQLIADSFQQACVVSVVEWLKRGARDQHGLNSKPTRAIVSLGKTLHSTFPC